MAANVTGAVTAAGGQSDVCPICLDALNTKRVATFDECGHRFHLTCANGWLETRKMCCQHKCPMCRAIVRCIVDEGGRHSYPGFPFGSNGKPTTEIADRLSPREFRGIVNDTQIRIVRCDELMKDQTKGKEFMDDVQSEKTQMKKRLAALKRLEKRKRKLTEYEEEREKERVRYLTQMQSDDLPADRLRRFQQICFFHGWIPCPEPPLPEPDLRRSARIAARAAAAPYARH